MGATSFWHIAIVALVIVLLFGRGKISDLMGDVAKGIKSFKQGLSDEDKDEARTVQPAPRLNATAERAPERHVASDEPVKG